MISMKKIFNYLLIATLLIGTAVSFSSCKDDDEENENIPVNNGGGTGTTSSTYNIIGTWKCSYDSGYTLLTLNSDGTCVWTDVSYTYGKEYDYGSYTYSNGVLTFKFDGERETIGIKWLNANSFQDEDGEIWYRQ